MIARPYRTEARTYSGVADLRPLLQFASKASVERLPLIANWHPGDFVWGLKGAYDQRQPIRLWDSTAGIRAVAWFVGSNSVWLEALPDDEDLVPEVVGWAEALVRKRAVERGDGCLSIRAFERDDRRMSALENLGYQRSGPEGVQYRMDLKAPRPTPDRLTGFIPKDSVGIDPDVRARAHRDAWNDLAHIGIANARSTFTDEIYRSLREAPVYDPRLDIVVEARDGRLVSNCICWADDESGIGMLEPVGTSAAFRGRGLAVLAISEGLRRLQARGHDWARWRRALQRAGHGHVPVLRLRAVRPHTLVGKGALRRRRATARLPSLQKEFA